MKNIILSADDFGRSHERNLAIDCAMKSGFIKSAALLVNTKFTQEAVKMAHEGGWIENLHCHLNLVSGEISGYAKPLNKEYAECSALCDNGEFKQHGDYNFYNRYSLRYANKVFAELEAQYKKFIDLTENKANNYHLDFHLYYNRNLPIALAMRKLVKKYHIKTVRYFGEHHKLFGKRMKLKLMINSLFAVKNTNVAKSCNVDYYLTKKNDFQSDEFIELYVHPDYIDGKLMDNSISNFGNEKRLLVDHYNLVKDDGELISWNDLN